MLRSQNTPNCGRLLQRTPAVSAISYVEVLGYHKLIADEQRDLETFFAVAPMLSVTLPILNQAIQLRQQRKMTLGDSLVAATALVHDVTLVTRNTKDFVWIPHLKLLNPFDQPLPS
jgi:predicted nucleic acid-binding protein